jgi:hypothetical protein
VDVAAPKTHRTVPITDLREICRYPDRLRCSVFLFGAQETGGVLEVPWLILGQVSLTEHAGRRVGCATLSARMGFGATDAEEDAAWVLKLPLIGLRFSGVDYHVAEFAAWVDLEAEGPFHSDFRVPSPGYNPVKDPRTKRCRSKNCEPKGHPIVPEGLYVPPFDPGLYASVRGRKVSIRIGPTTDLRDGEDA